MGSTGPDTVILRRNVRLKKTKNNIDTDGAIEREKNRWTAISSAFPSCLTHSRDFHHRQACRREASLSRFGINIKIRRGVKLTDGPNSWREGGAAWKGVERVESLSE